MGNWLLCGQEAGQPQPAPPDTTATQPGTLCRQAGAGHHFCCQHLSLVVPFTCSTPSACICKTSSSRPHTGSRLQGKPGCSRRRSKRSTPCRDPESSPEVTGPSAPMLALARGHASHATQAHRQLKCGRLVLQTFYAAVARKTSLHTVCACLQLIQVHIGYH